MYLASDLLQAEKDSRACGSLVYMDEARSKDGEVKWLGPCYIC